MFILTTRSLKCCSSVFWTYFARLESKRRTARTGGIRTTRRMFPERTHSLQIRAR
ncbi:hypothetical protein LINPERPRIM_LOCUS31293 [Linum perenne]